MCAWLKSENLFEIWRFLGKGTPFIARRHNWFHLSYMVTRVEPKGYYGKAFGYRLIDGKPENDCLKEECIDCSGNGTWELIENCIERADNLQWNCLDENNILLFGKYKGLSATEVRSKDPDYFCWALGYVGGFGDLLFSRRHNITLQEILDVKKQIKSLLSITSDDWIKSPVDINFDTKLDEYKYACICGNKDVTTAVKEIEEYYNGWTIKLK